MFVYNELFDAPQALLVYPSVEDALSRRGHYVGRGHKCHTLHLGLFDGGRWSPTKLQEEVKGLLRTLAGAVVVGAPGLEPPPSILSPSRRLS
jgi:hypothetical protein